MGYTIEELETLNQKGIFHLKDIRGKYLNFVNPILVSGCTGSLEDVIEQVDNVTNDYPVYYMINCVHPDYFIQNISNTEFYKERNRVIRANVFCKSHADLDNSASLEPGSSK